MIRFSRVYCFYAIVLFVTEALIAAFMHDAFIRPTFGDFLVVILLYCGFRAFIQANFRVIAVLVLYIAYLVEISQYFHLIVHLGLRHSTAAQLILGTGFAWGDMLAYTLGVALVWIIEARREKRLKGVNR